jgi:hypothetical protein
MKESENLTWSEVEPVEVEIEMVEWVPPAKASSKAQRKALVELNHEVHR